MTKSIKFFAGVLLVAVSLFSFCACGNVSTELSPVSNAVGGFNAAADETLVVYNWEDYIGETTVADFEAYYLAQTGKSIKVTYSTFDTNETMLTQILRGDSAIDLICPSEYAIQRLIGANKLVSLSTLQTDSGYTLQNKNNVISDIYTKVEEVIPGMGDYFTPYMWGTLGILYNTAYVTEADLAEGWGLLWNAADNKALKKKILFKDSVRDAYVAGVLRLKETKKLDGTKYADYSIEQLINCTDDELMNLAEEILIEQKKVAKGYEVDLGKDDLIAGRAYVDLAWSGDAMYAIELAAKDDVSLDYFVPEVGSNIWFDGWCVPTSVQNKKAALMWIDFMCQLDVSAANMSYIGYTSAADPALLRADADAVAVLTENGYDNLDEFFDDAIRYPDTSDAKLGVMKDFGADNAKASKMWENVKNANTNNIGMLLCIIFGIVGGVALVVVVFMLIKKKSNRRVKA